jgi:hypothetical protein
MLKWEQEIINSKDLVLLNREDIGWEKFDFLFNQVIREYNLYRTEISELMMDGLKKFYSDCKEKEAKIALRYDVYSRMLRWIITRNNPRYLQVKFDEFRKAIKDLWVLLFGNYFHEFRYPNPIKKKQYINDRKEWDEWFKCIGGKIKK